MRRSSSRRGRAFLTVLVAAGLLALSSFSLVSEAIAPNTLFSLHDSAAVGVDLGE